MTNDASHGSIFDVKNVIALCVILGTFAILGIYVVRGQVPDATIVGMISLPLGAVIGFYFGHINGAATALASATTQLAATAQAAVEKRSPLSPPDAPPPVVVLTKPPIGGDGSSG